MLYRTNLNKAASLVCLIACITLFQNCDSKFDSLRSADQSVSNQDGLEGFALNPEDIIDPSVVSTASAECPDTSAGLSQPGGVEKLRLNGGIVEVTLTVGHSKTVGKYLSSNECSAGTRKGHTQFDLFVNDDYVDTVRCPEMDSNSVCLTELELEDHPMFNNIPLIKAFTFRINTIKDGAGARGPKETTIYLGSADGIDSGFNGNDSNNDDDNDDDNGNTDDDSNLLKTDTIYRYDGFNVLFEDGMVCRAYSNKTSLEGLVDLDADGAPQALKDAMKPLFKRMYAKDPDDRFCE